MILVTGASGRIGRRAATLLAAGQEPLRLMSRHPERVPKLAGATLVRGDFAQPETLPAAFAGVDTALIVSAQAPPGERAQLHRDAFAAAAAAGVRHIVYLSMRGASPTSRYPYSRDHYESEQHLAATGVPFTALRNAFYVDMFLEKFDDDGVLRGPDSGRGGAFIAREDAAQAAAAAAARRPGGIFDVTGPELLNPAEVARRLAEQSGVSLHFEEQSAETLYLRLRKQGHDEAAARLLVDWFVAVAAGEQAPVADGFRRLTGRGPQPMERYFAAFPELLDPLRQKSR